MGGIIQVGKDEHSPWTGGLPKSDWSGLQPSASTVPVSPNQYRPFNIATSQKGHIYRQQGLPSKFTRNNDLASFEHQVWQHLLDTGMDTIAYVPDPIEPLTMVNSVKGHYRFSIDSCSKMIATQLLKYDAYDRTNNLEATNFLFNSLSKDLSQELRDVIVDEDPFPVVFVHLMNLLRSTSIDRFENIKVKIKTRHPSKYPGQDVSRMASDFRADAQLLEIAGQYDHNLTLHMIDAFLEAGGLNNEDYRYPLRSLKVRHESI